MGGGEMGGRRDEGGPKLVQAKNFLNSLLIFSVSLRLCPAPVIPLRAANSSSISAPF